MTYQIDGVDMVPQPTEHEWPDYQIPLGFDGNGAPFYKKYSTLILRCNVVQAEHFWHQYADGATHTVDVPAPGTVGRDPGDFVTYSSIYVGEVREGLTLRKSGMQSVEMRLMGFIL